MEGWCERLGISALYPFQSEAIAAFAAGKDVFVSVPTAGGKSFCYILPALMTSGLVLVVSPLIALMRDQLTQLRRLAIPAATLDSMQNPDEKREVMSQLSRGELDLLFVSPERLALPSFREFLAGLSVALIAVDEAHCVNQWGHDFRPEYLRLGTYLRQISPGPKMALTATASRHDRLAICQALGLNQPVTVGTEETRNNLRLWIFRPKGLADHETQLLNATLNESGPGIIYTATRKKADEIKRLLERAGLEGVGVYHAGLGSRQRLAGQRAFERGDVRVMVATKAFGLGINKRDIRFVFHASMPNSVESYVQEVGRAGRDGEPARAYLFYGPRDFYIQKFMLERSFPETDLLRRVYQTIRQWFQGREAMPEQDVIGRLEALYPDERQDLARVLDFLLRDQLLERLEVPADLWDQGTELSAVVCWGRHDLTIDQLCRELEQKKGERLERLRTMHRMVKSGGDPTAAIASYFR